MKILKLLMVSVVILLFLSSASALAGQPVERPTKADCSNISSLGLTNFGIMLDQNKVISLFRSIGSSDIQGYYCVKNLLGLWDYDMYIEITKLDGQYVVLNNTLLVYGVYPGQNSESQILSGVDYSKMLQLGLSSPNYATTHDLNDLYTSVVNGDLTGIRNSHGGTLTPENAPDTYNYTAAVINKIIPDIQNYSISRTFTRLALLDVGNHYELVRVTLGVWK